MIMLNSCIQRDRLKNNFFELCLKTPFTLLDKSQDCPEKKKTRLNKK